MEQITDRQTDRPRGRVIACEVCAALTAPLGRIRNQVGGGRARARARARKKVLVLRFLPLAHAPLHPSTLATLARVRTNRGRHLLDPSSRPHHTYNLFFPLCCCPTRKSLVEKRVVWKKCLHQRFFCWGAGLLRSPRWTFWPILAFRLLLVSFSFLFFFMGFV